MTMHLAHPALSTTGKRKGKKKWASAEAKRRAEKLEQEWQALKNKYATTTKKSTSKTATASNNLDWRSRIPDNRRTDHIGSVDTGTGMATKRESPTYTGDKCIGITILHKSCLQPVFNKESAVDAAKMRRG